MLCQAGGILNVGDETRIYHGRWRNTPYGEEYYGEVALATLPRDRWGALGLFPDQTEGSVWSCPVTLPAGGCRMILNADRACDMRVEIADERFNLIPAYSGEQSGAVQDEGGLDCPVDVACGQPGAARRSDGALPHPGEETGGCRAAAVCRSTCASRWNPIRV